MKINNKKNKSNNLGYVISVGAGILIIVTTVMACKIHPDPKICDCEPKDHLGVGDNCNCGADTHDCTVKVYGTITCLNGKVIKIHRQGSVSDAQAIAAAANIIAAYNDLDTGGKLDIPDKIDEIRIINNTFSYKNDGGKLILSINFSAPGGDILDILYDIADGYIQPEIAHVNRTGVRHQICLA